MGESGTDRNVLSGSRSEIVPNQIDVSFGTSPGPVIVSRWDSSNFVDSMEPQDFPPRFLAVDRSCPRCDWRISILAGLAVLGNPQWRVLCPSSPTLRLIEVDILTSIMTSFRMVADKDASNDLF
jgi:hypothetical protein